MIGSQFRLRLTVCSLACLLSSCFEDAGSSDGGTDTDATGTMDDGGGDGSTDDDDGGASGSGGTGGDTDTDKTGDTGGDTGTDTGTGTGTTTPACPTDTHLCTEGAPDGWSGPIVAHEGSASETSPTCEGDYPGEAVTAFDGLTAPNANCTCTCENPSPTGCDSATLQRTDSSSQSCERIPDSTYTITTSCSDVAPTLGETGWFLADVPDATGGSCEEVLTEEVPAISWSTVFTGCGGATPEQGECSSSNDVCLPQPANPYESNLCIWTTGDVDCPDGSYTARRVRYTETNDTRDCMDDCACGTYSGSCGGTIVLYNQDECADPHTDDPTSCKLMKSYVRTAQYEPDPSGSCTASGGTATGSASKSGAVTICCTE